MIGRYRPGGSFRITPYYFVLTISIFLWLSTSPLSARSTNKTSLTVPYRGWLEFQIFVATLKKSCSDVAYKIGDGDGFLPKDVMLKFREKDEFICQFELDKFSYLLDNPYKRINSTIMEADWNCDLNLESVCDGISQCATDECSCERTKSSQRVDADVFYCIDGSGCISFANVCDDRRHCRDGSDERFCPGFVELTCSDINETNIFISPEKYWEKHALIKSFNCAPTSKLAIKYAINGKNPIDWCMSDDNPELENRYDSIFQALFNLPYADREIFFENLCRDMCKNLNHSTLTSDKFLHFCDHISFHSGGARVHFTFTCNKTVNRNAMNPVELTQICDGTIDCLNGADERACPGTFYCSANGTEIVQSIPETKVCDHVKDCSNGADECDTCDFGAVSSRKSLIRSKPILIMTIAVGSLIIVLNILEGYKCYKAEPTAKAGKIDRVLRLQIFVYDGLMGLYLVCIFVSSIILGSRDDYCLLEQQWRSSIYCSAHGMIFSFSSHGSLFTVAYVSVVRCLKCVRSDIDQSKSMTIIGSFIIFILNLVHSVVPLLPFDSVQHVFRTGIYFKNLDENPFFEKNPINISRLSWIYETAYQKSDKNLYTMLSDFRKMTSRPTIFDTTEISYYGNTGICVHNIFKQQPSYEIYIICYLATVFLLLLVVLLTYSIIIREKRKSDKRLAGIRVANVQNDAPNESISLTLKVFLMIGSQLLAWSSLIFTTIYYQYVSADPVPPMVFEVFALLVVPVNSLLNPLFYSDLYKVIAQGIKRAWKFFMRKCGLKVNAVSPRVEEIEMAGFQNRAQDIIH